MEQNTTEAKKATRGLQSFENQQTPRSYPFPTEVITLP